MWEQIKPTIAIGTTAKKVTKHTRVDTIQLLAGQRCFSMLPEK